jgi:biotin carboxyl carrier protein
VAVIQVKADIAGTVCQVVVEVGSQVAEDDTLILLDSMKMEIPLLAPCAGRVTQIHSAQGDMVSEGDVLVRIET